MQTLQEGSLLQGGKYRVKRTLGQGGFGITYEGIQEGLERRVAIKEFFMKDYCDRDGSTNHVTVGTEGLRETVSRYREKFIKEARMIAALDRAPHIVRIHDIFEENETAYYVMEFVEGGSLDALVKTGGPLPEARALELTIQTAQALSSLHQRQTMHLDVKPANILLRKDDQGRDDIVLIDFGISKHYNQKGQQTTTTPVGYSKGFAPVEQYNEGGVDCFSPATDVYSLGATLYYLLSGKTPPEATTLIDDPLPCPTGISDGLWQVISRAMKSGRKARYQSAQEMEQALQELRYETENEDEKLRYEDENETNPSVSPTENRATDYNVEESAPTVLSTPDDEEEPRPRSQWWKWAIGIAAAAAVAALLFIIFSKKTDPGQDPYLLYKQAMVYFDQNEYDKAFPLMLEAAEAGCDSAQYEVGYLYNRGWGTEKDYDKALEWYRKAAEAGLASAQNDLGVMYIFGNGVTENKEEAVRWFQKSADQGEPRAQINLALRYAAGDGTVRDTIYAKQLFKAAIQQFRVEAESGDAESQLQLAHLYYYGGWDVAVDRHEAAKWAIKAANNNNPDAWEMLGYLYYYGEGVPQNNSEAAKWYRKASELGFVNSQAILGNLLLVGFDEIPQNVTEGVKWLKSAAEQGDLYSQFRLGFLYENGGDSVLLDRNEAAKWYRMAADQGDTVAINALVRLGETY
ncbi:MAG: SEL1-like repeat protein [Prevotella sp.]|nr:SEL1-like repeat protein [Prevotella sp.]